MRNKVNEIINSVNGETLFMMIKILRLGKWNFYLRIEEILTFKEIQTKESRKIKKVIK